MLEEILNALTAARVLLVILGMVAFAVIICNEFRWRRQRDKLVTQFTRSEYKWPHGSRFVGPGCTVDGFHFLHWTLDPDIGRLTVEFKGNVTKTREGGKQDATQEAKADANT